VCSAFCSDAMLGLCWMILSRRTLTNLIQFLTHITSSFSGAGRLETLFILTFILSKGYKPYSLSDVS